MKCDFHVHTTYTSSTYNKAGYLIAFQNDSSDYITFELIEID